MSPFGSPQFYLFANRLNHRLLRYFSPCPDLKALVSGRTVDAMAEGSPLRISASYNSRLFSPKDHQGKPRALLQIDPLHTVAT